MKVQAAALALSLAAFAAAPAPLDLAPFARFTHWEVAPSRDVGLEWREERDVREVIARFKGPAPVDIKLQYWQSTWPSPAPEMPTVEDPADDPYQGHWLTAATEGGCKSATCRWLMAQLEPAENPLAANLPGVTYRRTLKIRLVSASAMPAVEGLSAYSESVEQPASVRIQLGHGDARPLRWTGSVTVTNGRLLGLQALGFERGDTLRPPDSWSFVGAPSAKGVTLNLVTARHSLPGSLDGTLVSVRAVTDREDRSFTFSIDDLSRGPIYIPDMHAYISDASAAEGFRPPAGKGPHIRTMIPREPEQTYRRASTEIPPLDPWQDQYGRRIYMPLAAEASWQKFALEYGGDVFIDKHGTKAMGRELKRLEWKGDRIAWRIGTGASPTYREDRQASVSLHDGSLPAITQTWETGGLRYAEEAFATLVRGPLSPRDPARDEQTPAVLMMRIAASNNGTAARTAHVWVSIEPAESLRLENGGLWASGATGRPLLRAVVSAGAELVALPGAADRQALHFAFPIAAGGRESVIVKLPFVPDLDSAGAAEIARLDYDAQRDRVLDYWRARVDAFARIVTPEPSFNEMLRATLWHIGMSTTKDPVSGFEMAPAASYYYKVYANEACFQALFLDAVGDHQGAAAMFEPMLRLQGSRSFPGLHQGGGDAILHGVRVNEDYDYTASTYGLDHSTILWSLGEHYLYTRDKEWFERAWPNIRKAIGWVRTQRAAGAVPGLMPASSLEDNSDWAQWFSTNSFAWAGMDRVATALADLGHPEAAELRREADEYRHVLRAAVLRAVREAPVQPTRDGTYAPNVPIEPNLRIRRFGPQRAAYYRRYGTVGVPMLRLAATREVLYGPIILLNLGVFAPTEPIADWILDDWEDNVTLTSGLGMNVHGETDDRLWFSQGGMVFQANLQNPILAYLKRHEILAAVRGVYNNFVACFYPGAIEFTEEFRAWSHASGPFYKISDEAKWANRLRDLFVLEDGATLYLGSGLPRRWWLAESGGRAERVSSYFGEVGLRWKRGSDAGEVDIAVDMPRLRTPEKVWLVVRLPAGRISRVTMNGRPWTRIDAAREAIELPPGVPHVSVQVR